VVTVRALAAAAAAAVVALTCEALLPDGLGSLIVGVGLTGVSYLLGTLALRFSDDEKEAIRGVVRSRARRTPASPS